MFFSSNEARKPFIFQYVSRKSIPRGVTQKNVSSSSVITITRPYDVSESTIFLSLSTARLRRRKFLLFGHPLDGSLSLRGLLRRDPFAISLESFPSTMPPKGEDQVVSLPSLVGDGCKCLLDYLVVATRQYTLSDLQCNLSLTECSGQISYLPGLQH